MISNPLIERSYASSPPRVLMRGGEWVVPEEKRPERFVQKEVAPGACPRCGARMVKNGFDPRGRQRTRCKGCQRPGKKTGRPPTALCIERGCGKPVWRRAMKCGAKVSMTGRRCYFHQHSRWNSDARRRSRERDPLVGRRKRGRPGVPTLCPRCGAGCGSGKGAKDHCRRPRRRG